MTTWNLKIHGRVDMYPHFKDTNCPFYEPLNENENMIDNVCYDFHELVNWKSKYTNSTVTYFLCTFR